MDLVGHSLGGLVACAVTAAHPGSVRRLVLEDVGVPHARPVVPLSRPDGELEFDWAMVEQVRPEIDDLDARCRRRRADRRPQHARGTPVTTKPAGSDG